MSQQALTLQIKLMAREASERREDAALLSSSLSSHSDSASLLELLAFEILLKAVLRIHDRPIPRSHTYCDLFGSLPKEVQEELLRAAAERMGPHADYSDVHTLLRTWGSNFIALRYPYERYEGMSEPEYLRRGEEWHARGAPASEADFTYHPEELRGLLDALQSTAESWLVSPSAGV